MNVDVLSDDYRDFDKQSIPYEISNRILSPVLRIDNINGKYVARLGANIKRNNKKYFIACLSNSHNWILDGEKIKPLPYDAQNLVRQALLEDNPLDLNFHTVLFLKKNGIEGVVVDVAKSVFEKANKRAACMSLDKELPRLKANLYKYQEHGVAWMDHALGSVGGLILADEMGLGKTIQIIATLLLKEPTKDHPALIICPTTLIANWQREIKSFAPTLTMLVHRGSGRTGFYKDLMRSQIVITTYDTLVNDISIFLGVNWSFLICDEAQAAKNPESQRRKALGKVPRRYTIPVTGTPMENTLLDLWSLSDLAIPGVLGDQNSFEALYPDTESSATELSDIVDTYILKRRVEDVANDLPERTDIDLPIELDKAGEEEYLRIRNDVIEEYGKSGRLVAVGQLAIYCAHPWLRLINPNSKDLENNDEIRKTASNLFTPKIEICTQLLKEAFITGKKVLIFAAYNNCSELIKKAASIKGLPNAYWNTINGATPQSDRQAIVDQFSEYHGPGVLILNPKAAGAGLNITAATVVIHYTQNWNPALEMQASARAHRRGQDLPVTIYRLYYLGTVEETMIERSHWKRELGAKAVPISSRENKDLDKALTSNPFMKI